MYFLKNDVRIERKKLSDAENQLKNLDELFQWVICQNPILSENFEASFKGLLTNKTFICHKMIFEDGTMKVIAKNNGHYDLDECQEQKCNISQRIEYFSKNKEIINIVDNSFNCEQSIFIEMENESLAFNETQIILTSKKVFMSTF